MSLFLILQSALRLNYAEYGLSETEASDPAEVAAILEKDLYDQWHEMDHTGKWRYTSPTHIVRAFYRALDELEAEGGIPGALCQIPGKSTATGRWDGQPGFCGIAAGTNAIAYYYIIFISK